MKNVLTDLINVLFNENNPKIVNSTFLCNKWREKSFNYNQTYIHIHVIHVNVY